MVIKYTSQPIPKVGKKYPFFDNGKVKRSLLYQATVLEIYDPDKVPGYVKRAIDRARKKEKIFKPTTDKVICCSIKDYDDNNIWIIRTKEDAWYSVCIQNEWQGGLLDVDNHLKDWLDSQSK